MSLPGRKRLACDGCTRKKIKCDKTVPCSNCTKRGLQDACTRNGEPDVFRPLSVAATSAEDGASIQPQQNAVTDQTTLIASMSARLAELESTMRTLRNSATPARPTDPLQNETPFSQPPPQTLPEPDTSRTDTGLALAAASPLFPGSTPQNTTSADSEAASILEFLAWGRRKPDGHVAVTPDYSHLMSNNVGDSDLEYFSEDGLFGAEPPFTFLQVLLPSRQQIEQLVTYHEECLLWYHGSFFPPVFRKQLSDFFNKHDGTIEEQGVNLQWVALLFSILTGTMCCAPLQQIKEWGFHDAEKTILSKQWHRAVITCLNAGDFMTRHQLVSCEAIATLTLPAHLLGCSNNQSVLLASAVRIAQSLGLHRLRNDTKDPAVERGRRVWCQLCTQDWFGVPFSESYNINPLYSQTGKPTNCHEDEMMPLPDFVPTRAGYPRFLLDIARIMPQLQDGIASSNTMYTKYEQVLKYDKQMRALSTTHRPYFLSNAPIDPEWPRWVPWARRSLTISSAHKIIMIHRHFLAQSFTSSPFKFTRKTCIAAAKTILKEQKQADSPDAPHLWIYDAFNVAACIILCLDLLYRDPEDPECTEHRKLVEEAIDVLRNVDGSMIAKRGVRLLTALLSEEKISISVTENARKRNASELTPAGGAKRRRHFDMVSFVKKFCDGSSQTPAPSSGQETPVNGETALETPNNEHSRTQPIDRPSDVDSSYTNRLLKEAQDQSRSRGPTTSSDMLSPRGNFENVSAFENLLFLAQTYNI